MTHLPLPAVATHTCILGRLLQRSATFIAIAIPSLMSIEPRVCEAEALRDSVPNVVYILADDLGYGDLSCYGQKKFSTPNIDRLAREGMKFTQHYSGSTVCAPTRSCLMTGQHTGHTYIRGNRGHKPIGEEPLPAEIVTLAELLHQAGYATGAFGKWGLGYPGSEGDPIHQGFDTFFGYNGQRQAHDFYPPLLFHDERRVELDGKTYAHELIVRQALKFIREHRDRPFFCYLPVTIPHAAMQVPAEYHDPWRKRLPQFEDRIGRYSHDTRVKNPVAAFAGMMTKLDEDVGRVLALIDELGLDRQTIVMFTSDNGPHHEGGHDPGYWDSNGPLTGHKRDLTEGGIRVPMLARWPGRIAPGTVADHISAHWDVLPTCCELAGVSPCKQDIDGLSFLPTLLGQPEKQREHDYLYWEFTEQGGKRAARAGRWKAIQLDLLKQPPGKIQLYDLENDLAEQNDIAADHPEVVARMERLMNEAHEPSKLFPIPMLDKQKETR